MSRPKQTTFCILGIALFIAMPRPAMADSILLRDGKTVTGKITGENDRSVIIDAANGRFTFSRDEILTATKESTIMNQFRIMEDLLSRGNIDAAIFHYHNSGIDKKLSPTALDNAILQHLKSNAIGVISTSATALQLADKYTANDEIPVELRLLAAALCMDTDNPDRAAGLLRQINADIPTRLIWPSETISGLLNRIADSAIATKEGAVLAASASLAGHLPLPRDSSSTKHLNFFTQIENLIYKKQFIQATSLFHPELFLHRADLFRPLAKRLLTAILAAPPNDTSLTALESASVTILPYTDSILRKRCMKILITRLMDSDRRTDAQRITDEIAMQNPDLGAILQHLIEFQNRKTALPPDALMDRYKLAAWGRSMGLLDESKALFSSLRNDPRFAETAKLQLTLIEHAQGYETVNQLRQLYDDNEIDRLKIESEQFLKTSPPDEFAQQTRDLLQLADFQNWSQKQSTQGMAEAEFQQAERMANRQEYDKALMHLNRIQLNREDSAAAKKAHALRDRIMYEKLKLREKKRR